MSAAAIATLLGVTPRYIHLLLEETGRSFTHHLLERRLKAAAALLRDPRQFDCKITDIATEAGFTELSYFNRAFRRHYGATPSDVRREGDKTKPMPDEATRRPAFAAKRWQALICSVRGPANRRGRQGPK